MTQELYEKLRKLELYQEETLQIATGLRSTLPQLEGSYGYVCLADVLEARTTTLLTELQKVRQGLSKETES